MSRNDQAKAFMIEFKRHSPGNRREVSKLLWNSFTGTDDPFNYDMNRAAKELSKVKIVPVAEIKMYLEYAINNEYETETRNYLIQMRKEIFNIIDCIYYDKKEKNKNHKAI